MVARSFESCHAPPLSASQPVIPTSLLQVCMVPGEKEPVKEFTDTTDNKAEIKPAHTPKTVC